jgi:hypothetical protein
MAFTFDVNTIPATGAVTIFKLRTALLVQLWTSQKDSDGTTFSNTGVQLTSGGSGANGLGNTDAWFVVRDPNSTRSVCWQRGTSNSLWRVKYSRSAGFVGGSPSATQVPSATDEAIIFGGGTDAAPTFQQQWTSGQDGNYRVNIIAGDATVGYGFLMDAFVSGSPSSTHVAIMLDVMAAGSFPVADTDPAVFYTTPVNGVTTALGSDTYANVTQAKALMGAGAFVGIHSITGNDPSLSIQCFPADASGKGVSTNAFSGEDAGIPLGWGRSIAHAGPNGFKGFSGMLRWSGTFRSNGDTISNTAPSSRDKMWVNGCLIPWDGSVPIF